MLPCNNYMYENTDFSEIVDYIDFSELTTEIVLPNG